MQYKHTTKDGRDITLFFEHNQGYCLNVSQSSVETLNPHSATNYMVTVMQGLNKQRMRLRACLE